jgi:hypothetical protein
MVWISVEDPPKTRDTVLLCESRDQCPPEYIQDPHVVSAWYGVSDTDHPNSQPCWRYVSDHDLKDVRGTPLYWMPAPELPKEKDDD